MTRNLEVLLAGEWCRWECSSSKELEHSETGLGFCDDWPMTFEEEDNGASAQTDLISVAMNFLGHFYTDSLARSWPLVHPRLRICWVQWWITANTVSLQQNGYDLVQITDALASDSPTGHPLWTSFERVFFRDFREANPLDPATCRIGDVPRVIALDTELLLVHAKRPHSEVWEAGTYSDVYSMVVQLNDGEWTVLNWASDLIPTPGYPPIL